MRKLGFAIDFRKNAKATSSLRFVIRLIRTSNLKTSISISGRAASSSIPANRAGTIASALELLAG